MCSQARIQKGSSVAPDGRGRGLWTKEYGWSLRVGKRTYIVPPASL